MLTDPHMPQSKPPLTPKLFYTNLNSVRVSIYATLEGENLWSDGWRMEGNIYGPGCKLSDTLPARIQLKDLGNGSSLLSSAVVPDPCPWSAELPATYEVTTHVTQNGETIQSEKQLIGFKTLAVKANKFELTDLNGFTKRWVLRAAAGSIDSALSDDGEECRELRLSRLIRNPSRTDCQRATRDGLWIIAILDPNAADFQDSLYAMTRWPCVACCVLPASTELTSEALNNHLLMAAHVTSESHVPDWADLVIAEVNDPHEFNSRWASSEIPVVALGYSQYNNDRKARKMCAALQASLAPHTDYAGYVVSTETLC